MPYTYGTTNIKKNNYEIYVRVHKAAEIINEDNVLKGMLKDIAAFDTDIVTDGTDQGDEFITVNRIYNVTGTDSFAGIFNLASSVAGVDGEIIIVQADESGKNSGDALTNNITVTDELAVDKILNAQGEIVMFLKKAGNWTFSEWINSDGFQKTEYTKIGACEEKPTLKTSQGASIVINSGDELVISENLEITFNDLQITENNYTFIKSLTQVDLIFYNNDNLLGTVMIYNVLITPFLEVTGNDLNKMNVTFKLETGDVDDYLVLYTNT